MYARVNSFQVDPKNMAQATKYANETLIPTLQKMKGYKGYLGLSDPTTGRSYAIVFWEDEAAMKASEQAAGQVRSSAVSALNVGTPQVERMEVVIDTRK